MSTRATQRRRSWITELAGQAAAVAAVPVAILLAMAMKPQPTIETRSEPLWHNLGHQRGCPACRLLSHQAETPPPPLAPPSRGRRVIPVSDRIEPGVAAPSEATAEAALGPDPRVTRL